MNTGELHINRQTDIARNLINAATQDLKEGTISQETINARMNAIFNQLEKLPSLDTQLQGNLQKLLALCQTHKFTLTTTLSSKLVKLVNENCLRLL